LKENGHYLTVTNLVQKLSEENNIPASTLRYNIKQLVSNGLMTCGNANNKGIPARLTEDGMLILRLIGDG